MSNYTPYDPATHSLSSLVAALLGSSSGINVTADSITLKYGSSTSYDYDYDYDYDPAADEPIVEEPQYVSEASISFYDGSLTALNIGAGLLLTSGDASPGLTNTSSSYGQSLSPSETDTDLSATVHAAFSYAGEVYNATVLQFQFTLADTSLQNIQFDLVFGSDEYPEYSDSSYVDIAGVYVNGTNYAFFNDSSSQPLSVLDVNLSAGAFVDNTGTVLPIEYDGVSNKLTIIAPVTAGTNTLKIAIGDTGDSAYDSGVFISNLRAVNYSGSGLAKQTDGTDGSDVQFGNENNDVMMMGDGMDILAGLTGNDVLNGGGGIDFAAFLGAANDYLLEQSGDGYLIEGADGNDVLSDVERLWFENGGLFAIDTAPGENAWEVYALLNLFDAASSTDLLSLWLHEMDSLGDLGNLSDQLLDTYLPGIADADVLSYLFQTFAGVTLSPQDAASLAATYIGPGLLFETAGDFVAFLAETDQNAAEIADIVGQMLPLNFDYFF